MAKNSIRDYSATNSSNTDIQSIDISEGCSPAGINNAIREVMADLKDVSTGAVALESPAFDSASLTGDLTFGDSDKAIFGAGSDLQIFHDGSNSFIDDAGTGVLSIRSNSISLGKYTGENLASFVADGAATLYYDNAIKLATTATGCDITGDISLSASDPRLDFTDTDNSLIASISANNGNLTYQTHNTNRHHIFNNGSVGIGTTVISNKISLPIGQTVNIGATAGTSHQAGNVGSVGLTITDGGIANGVRVHNTHDGTYSSTDIRFTTGIGGVTTGAERMRIDSSGNVMVGTASTTPNPGILLAPAGNITAGNSAGGSGFEFHTFRRSAVQIGSITQSGTTGVSYNTSSDYRLKENVVADWDATTRLKQLNPVRFNFISDADTTVDGFLAHEVQDIVPEAITGTHNGMRDEEYEVTPAVLDEDGNEVTPAVMGTRSVPDYQGIDQSKLVPLLVKTIQELEARITALEAN